MTEPKGKYSLDLGGEGKERVGSGKGIGKGKGVGKGKGKGKGASGLEVASKGNGKGKTYHYTKVWVSSGLPSEVYSAHQNNVHREKTYMYFFQTTLES